MSAHSAVSEPFYSGQEVLFLDYRNRLIYGILQEDYPGHTKCVVMFCEDYPGQWCTANLSRCRPY